MKFSNAKFLTTDAAHTPITPPFLLLFDVLVRFFVAYLMASSVGYHGYGPKPSSTGNLQPSVIFDENLSSTGCRKRP